MEEYQTRKCGNNITVKFTKQERKCGIRAIVELKKQSCIKITREPITKRKSLQDSHVTG